ncbi:hypothetical protein KUTeg_022554 [Tegillarca granosa]|uniref:SWIM-type domain-containing protein n=1 Tax=Tegillarca granosa TaxID=220873 RepID=A0ABQ9EC50_TEGGR|nr:hypothetical protein KUTeg_022554 [Tegillarca granosa]
MTPVVNQVCDTEGLLPKLKENLPPFNKVSYSTHAIKIPSVSFASIYHFMILRETESGRRVHNFRGLDRAVKHYDAGDVQNIEFAQVDETTVYIKGSCNASMKKTVYQVYVCASFSPDSKDTVDYAYCQCPIGLAQSCSHIGGLLFALSVLKRGQQPDDSSCTSKLCQWKIPRQNIKPQPASSLKIAKPKLKIDGSAATTLSSSAVSIDFDPRHSDDRSFNLDWSLNQLRELKTIFPKTAMSHLWNIPDEVPDAVCDEEMEISIYPLEEKGQRLCEVWRKLHRGRITSSIFGDVLAAGLSANSLVKQITKDEFRIEATGLKLCKTHSFIGASSDGKVTDGTDVGVLEIKCPFSVGGTKLIKC